jgi:hypothetical protein
MSHWDSYDASVEGRTVNIAQDHAVVGVQMGGGRPQAEAFAWVRDDHGDLWILAGRFGYGGLYARPEQMTISASIRSIEVTEAGPVVFLR